MWHANRSGNKAAARTPDKSTAREELRARQTPPQDVEGNFSKPCNKINIEQIKETLSFKKRVEGLEQWAGKHKSVMEVIWK